MKFNITKIFAIPSDLPPTIPSLFNWGSIKRVLEIKCVRDAVVALLLSCEIVGIIEEVGIFVIKVIVAIG